MRTLTAFECATGLAALLTATAVSGADLALPPRPADAPGASILARDLESLELQEREARILQEVLSGNVPAFYRHLAPVEVLRGDRAGMIWVACDYLSVGSDEDFMLMPGTPMLAQRLADALDCTLPTPRMVDLIQEAARCRLTPTPIPPSPAMVSMPVFRKHHELVWTQRRTGLDAHPLGVLTSGHKKDVVLTARLDAAPDKVAIYGWHKPDGSVIQPLYTGHTIRYVDYSHGLRLVRNRMVVDGRSTTVTAVLKDRDLAPLLSDEGALNVTRYATNAPGSAPP